MIKINKKAKKRLGKLGVGAIYFFGSRAAGGATFKSDYDIGVVFTDTASLNNKDIFIDIYDILSGSFPDQENKLDISLLQRANPILEMAAVRDGAVLFESNPKFRADYEEAVIKRYNDYLPIQKEFEEATLKAFSQ